MASRYVLVIVMMMAIIAAVAIWLRPTDVIESVAQAENIEKVEEVVSHPDWTPEELSTMRSLSLHNLPALPASESNDYADNENAARLGQQLFFDKRLSSNGEVSCASCHQPLRDFTDGLPVGVGIDTVARHTMSLIGVSYSPWLFWDGRADSLWSQALGPLEDASEHGGTRTQYAHIVERYYRDQYQAVFGDSAVPDNLHRLPAAAGPLGNLDELIAWEQMSEVDRDAVNRIFANIGKAMDAYQRKLLPQPSRFDAFADALAKDNQISANAVLSAAEQHGLKLFIGKADCTHCHNGPLLSNNDFHNTSVATEDESTLAEGRARGVNRVQRSEFSCLGAYSDADPQDCMELQFVKAQGSELMSAFRTPSLRNVARTPPYMHNGRFADLAQVIDHYATAPESVLGKSELVPLSLSETEKAQLIAFLTALDERASAAGDPWRNPPSPATASALVQP